MPPNHKENPAILGSLKKPDLILVHGFRGSPIGLEEIANILRHEYGYQVHVPAIPPFGGAPSLDTYTPENYANYLSDYVITQQLERPVLIGHSMGSIVVSAALTHNPKIFNSKSVLMSPISNRTAKPFRFVAPFSAILPSHIVDYITTKYLTTTRDKATLKEILAITHRCGVDHSPRRLEVFKAARFSTRYSITDFSPQQQILLLAGEHDHLIKKHHTTKAAQQLQAELQFLPNTGHIHNYEQPNETAKAIINFLES